MPDDFERLCSRLMIVEASDGCGDRFYIPWMIVSMMSMIAEVLYEAGEVAEAADD